MVDFQSFFFWGGGHCTWKMVKLVPSGKLTEQWNITIFNRKYIFNPGSFSIAMLVYQSVNLHVKKWWLRYWSALFKRVGHFGKAKNWDKVIKVIEAFISHRLNTPLLQPIPTGYGSSRFRIHSWRCRGIAGFGCAISGCVVIILDKVCQGIYLTPLCWYQHNDWLMQSTLTLLQTRSARTI